MPARTGRRVAVGAGVAIARAGKRGRGEDSGMTDSVDGPGGPVGAASGHPVRRLGRALIEPDSYGPVLLLIVFTYVFSVGVSASWAASLVVTVQIATVWVVLQVSQARRGVRRVASVLLVISAVGAVVNLFAGREAWSHGSISLVSALLYLIAPISIARHLLFRRQVDQQTVLGALDIYLLIGMLFAFMYHFLGVVGSGAFFGTDGDGTIAQDLFFSFTTLATTGYGNLVPAANPGQTVAVLEMLSGQLFLVTALAKVISAYRPARFSANDPPASEHDSDQPGR
jgi:ion channel